MSCSDFGITWGLSVARWEMRNVDDAPNEEPRVLIVDVKDTSNHDLLESVQFGIALAQYHYSDTFGRKHITEYEWIQGKFYAKYTYGAKDGKKVIILVQGGCVQFRARLIGILLVILRALDEPEWYEGQRQNLTANCKRLQALSRHVGSPPCPKVPLSGCARDESIAGRQP